jgi:hypothetical protein
MEVYNIWTRSKAKTELYMVAASSPKTSVTIHQSKRCYVPEDLNHHHRCYSLKYRASYVLYMYAQCDSRKRWAGGRAAKDI